MKWAKETLPRDRNTIFWGRKTREVIQFEEKVFVYFSRISYCTIGWSVAHWNDAHGYRNSHRRPSFSVDLMTFFWQQFCFSRTQPRFSHSDDLLLPISFLSFFLQTIKLFCCLACDKRTHLTWSFCISFARFRYADFSMNDHQMKYVWINVRKKLFYFHKLFFFSHSIFCSCNELVDKLPELVNMVKHQNHIQKRPRDARRYKKVFTLPC